MQRGRDLGALGPKLGVFTQPLPPQGSEISVEEEAEREYEPEVGDESWRDSVFQMQQTDAHTSS